MTAVDRIEQWLNQPHLNPLGYVGESGISVADLREVVALARQAAEIHALRWPTPHPPEWRETVGLPGPKRKAKSRR